jgi:hypothetical protein
VPEVRVFVRKRKVKTTVEAAEKEVKVEPRKQKVRVFFVSFFFYNVIVFIGLITSFNLCGVVICFT